MRRDTIAALAAALVVACLPAALTDADRAAIEDEITQLYAEQAEMISSVDMEGWLAQFDTSENFVLAGGGEFVGYGELDSVIRDHWPTIRETSFAWGELHIRVLSRDLATVSSTFEWSGVVGEEGIEEEEGTWTVVLGKQAGVWKIPIVAETRPMDDDDDD